MENAIATMIQTFIKHMEFGFGGTWNCGHNTAFAVGLTSVTDARTCGHNTAFAVGLSSLSDARAGRAVA
eukprot:8624574-Lingulodinium_polyedra.AAC.1